MTKPPNVGRSWRTPIKHDYLSSIVGQEAGAIAAIVGLHRGAWHDPNAGDAALIPGDMWPQSFPTVILAYHATHCRVTVHIRLHEIQAATHHQTAQASSRETVC